MALQVSQQNLGADWLGIIQSLGPTLSTIIVGVIGFGGVVLSVRQSAVLNSRQRQAETDHQTKSLAAALMGEIASILLIIELRGYIGEIERIINEGAQGTSSLESFNFYARQNYFEVFSGNVEKLVFCQGLHLKML